MNSLSNSASASDVRFVMARRMFLPLLGERAGVRASVTPTFLIGVSKCLHSAFLFALFAFSCGHSFSSEPQFQTRAIWAGPESFATAKAADETISRCQRAGLNLILPDVMAYQTVSFKSSHFKGRVAASDKFDPLAYLSQKCRDAGMKIQPWCCVYYEGVRDKSKKPLNEAWTVRSIAGKPFDKNFISPANPEVNPYLLSVMKDLLAYDIDGIHLDYIRYPGGAFDYSDAARKAFKAEKGFDPQDLLDHPGRIVSPELEKFPVRVLQPEIHAEKVWETTAIERTLDQAGLGHAFVSESPENIAKLRVPSLLIVSSYYDVPAKMVGALTDYATRGGTILWTDVPAKSLAASPGLQKLTGIASGRWIGDGRVALTAADNHPLARALSQKSFRTESLYEAKPQGALVIAKLADGLPGLLQNQVGKGRVITLTFHLMKSTSPEVAAIARQILTWCEAEAGVTTPSPLAAKRAEWVAWRGDRVTQLVRDLSIAAKQKNPKLVISSSGGPSPFEFYACYRDAHRWLAEGINDEVFPMNYTEDPAKLAEMLELQTASAPPGTIARIFPGLQIYAPRTADGKKTVEPQRATIVEEQLRVVRQHGYHGFCLFSCEYLTDDIIQVVRQFGK
jgi:uncharacterized lipoprotein YddW (UPF0748 family)